MQQDNKFNRGLVTEWILYFMNSTRVRNGIVIEYYSVFHIKQT